MNEEFDYLNKNSDDEVLNEEISNNENMANDVNMTENVTDNKNMTDDGNVTDNGNVTAQSISDNDRAATASEAAGPAAESYLYETVPAAAPVSEPYRYRYENGVKFDANENNAYRTYSYGMADASVGTGNTGGAAGTGNAESIADTASQKTPKKKGPFLKAVKWVACAACFGVIAGASFLGVSYLGSEVFGIEAIPIVSGSTDGDSDDSGEGTGTPDKSTGTPLKITINPASTIEGAENPAESVVVQVVEQNLAATVAVKSTYVITSSFFGQQYQQEAQSSGSGFIVGINDTELLIATNNHVIEDAKKIEITFIDEAVLEATVKGNDAIADLAILAVPLDTISADTLSAIRVATLGDSEEVRLGEMAIAIGNALGYGQSVTVGYISAKDREVTVDGNTMVLLQTDAAINGGNSGGPLFNTRGEVIGINSVKYADTEVEGMCFAIPISRAIPILNELMNRETLTDEERGYLGVNVRTVDSSISSLYGWPIGAYVVSISEGSPAEAANLYIGDIITAVNGVQIKTGDHLVSAVSSYRHGTTVEITVQRNVNGKYEEITLSATLAPKSEVLGEEESGNEINDLNGNSGNSSNGDSSGRRGR